MILIRKWKAPARPIRRAALAAIIAVMAAALALSASPGRAQTEATTETTGTGVETLRVLQSAVVPPADPIDLARRLRGVTDIPPNPTSPLRTYQVGDTRQFWVTNEDVGEDVQITAKLVYANDLVYMWYEVGVQVPNLSAIKRSVDKFATSIIPTVHRYFGVEASPGVDGDVHLYILSSRQLGSGIAGYYSGASSYPVAVAPRSNQAKIFMMNSAAEVPGTTDFEGTLAHEFQHMVHDNEDANEETWLNEGLSEVSRLVNGYADTGFAPQFMRNPGTQLNAWGTDNTLRHYGASYLFGTYFLQRFGPDAIKTLVSEPENGLTGIAVTLKAIKATDPITAQPVTVLDLYADWQAANLINNKAAADGRYAYTMFNEPLPPPVTVPLKVATTKATLNQFGTQYYTIDKPGTYTLSFSGDPTIQVVPTQPHSGRYAWWSNRADKSDTRLTRAFDLTGVQKATLNYWTWYSIEKGWDYGYVVASTDGGTSWSFLKTPDMTTIDPHGNAYGVGYGGPSGSEDEQATPKWVQESIDLSAFAGKQVLIRFEMVTDDALALPGMMIDDIRIPEIGYQTDAETGDDGWKAEGWVRIDNLLPQQFLIQQIDVAKDAAKTSVTRLLSPTASGPEAVNGQWTFTVGPDVQRTVIAVSGVTDYTTVPADFTITLKAN